MSRTDLSTLFAGIDVGSKENVLVVRVDGDPLPVERFANDVAGRKALAKRLRSFKRPVYICLEATGSYFWGIAIALSKEKNMRVMVANPRIIKNFARAMNRRSKTDAVDAGVIALYAEKAEFVSWEPPSEQLLELRNISRRIDSLTNMKAAEKCRLHAHRASGAKRSVVERDIVGHIKALEKKIAALRKAALLMIKSDAEILERYRLLLSIPGVGEVTAVRLIAELALMPGCLSARQWVAYAGLDPVAYESGTSIRRPGRMSKAGNARLRNALFIPALVAARCDPVVRAFADKLVSRNKKRIQALVAVMRKLLHAIWGMFRHNTVFDAAILFPDVSAQLPDISIQLDS